MKISIIEAKQILINNHVTDNIYADLCNLEQPEPYMVFKKDVQKLVNKMKKYRKNCSYN